MGGAPAFLFLWTLLRLLRRVVFVFLDFRDFLGHRLLEIRRGIRVIERLLELLEALVRLFEVVGVEDAEAVAYGRIFPGGDDLFEAGGGFGVLPIWIYAATTTR